MNDVVIRSIKNPVVVDFAAGIVYGQDGHSPRALAQTIRNWLAVSVRFLPDPNFDGDYVRAPDVLIAQYRRGEHIQGDCDDIAVLAASLGMAVGLFARFRAVAFSETEQYSHVWTELYDGSGWLVVDPTRAAGMPVIDRALVLDIE